jgi:hypothetical protein
MTVKDIKRFAEFLEKISPALQEYGFQVKSIAPVDIYDRCGKFVKNTGVFSFTVTPISPVETYSANRQHQAEKEIQI